jgi:hypothetical protein
MRVTIQDSAIMPEAFFTVDGDSYLPGVMTRGPWGAAMGGQIVGGLLGWGIERSSIDPDFQPARFTVDLLRPVLIEPVQVETSVQREGRRRFDRHGPIGTSSALALAQPADAFQPSYT